MVQLRSFGIPVELITFTDKGAYILENPEQWENGIKKEDLPQLLSYKEVADHIVSAITGDLND